MHDLRVERGRGNQWHQSFIHPVRVQDSLPTSIFHLLVHVPPSVGLVSGLGHRCQHAGPRCVLLSKSLEMADSMVHTGCFFRQGALVSKMSHLVKHEFLSRETEGPIRRDTVTLNRTSHFSSRKEVKIEQFLSTFTGCLVRPSLSFYCLP